MPNHWLQDETNLKEISVSRLFSGIFEKIKSFSYNNVTDLKTQIIDLLQLLEKHQAFADFTADVSRKYSPVRRAYTLKIKIGFQKNDCWFYKRETL